VVSAVIDSALVAHAWQVLAGVSDPEIPVISVVDLGIVRSVIESDHGIEVRVTPTYAGCPATHVIEADIIAALATAGVVARVITALAPPWSTDWISANGRARLREYGIAPPGHAAADADFGAHVQSLRFFPACPQCNSKNTECLSQFGSTPCKSLYRCLACREPFDYFKPL
jgi:ring-1,2-phenylacetyl-CoA epoxidase subunit PaaD